MPASVATPRTPAQSVDAAWLTGNYKRRTMPPMRALLPLIFCACATSPHSLVVTPHFVALTEPGARSVTIERRACVWSLFGLIPLGGDASIASATDGMLDQRGRRVTHVTIDEESTHYLVAARRCTIARATYVGGKAPEPVRVDGSCSAACSRLLAVLAAGGVEIVSQAAECDAQCPSWPPERVECVARAGDIGGLRACLE